MADMISDSDDDGSGDDYDREEYYSSEYDESDFEDMVHDSDLEYSDETESDSDSYVYPWPTSSDDSWASISSDDVIQKILLKLPTYDPPDSDEDDLKSASPSPSQFSDHGNDSVVEEDNNGMRSELEAAFAAEAELEFLQRFQMVPHPDDYDASDEMEAPEMTRTERKSSKILQPSQSSTATAKTPSPPMSPSSEEQKEKPPPIETPLKEPTPPPKVPHSPIVDAEPIPLVSDPKPKPKTSEDTKKKTTSDVGKKKPAKKPKANSSIKSNKLSTIKKPKGSSSKKPGTATAPASPVSKRRSGKKPVSGPYLTKPESKPKRGKRSHRKRKKKFQIDDRVEVLGKGPGIIRGIGLIDKKLIYGIELTAEEAKGTSDGIYNDVRYFECAENRAVFVERPSLQKIRPTRIKERKGHNNRNNALLFGRVMDDLFEERLKTAKSNYEKAPRKLGPRDYGRIKGWVGGDSEYRNALPADQDDFLGERTRRRKVKKGKKEKKMGPRDIGTAHGYRAPKWAKEVSKESNDNFLEERGRKPTLVEEAPKEKKLGPRDIGTAHGWRGTKMEDIEKKESNKPKDKPQIARKEGPRDIGTAHGWKGTKVVNSEAPKKKKKEKTPPPKKLGPRDMGRSKYKGTKLKKDGADDDFLGERTKKPKKAAEEKVRKPGPREIGRNRTFSRPKWDPDKQKQQQPPPPQ